jgi:hypothetical protein
MRQPLLWAALSYGSGIVAGSHVIRPISILLTATAVFVIAGCYWRTRRSQLGLASALVAFVMLGALSIQLRSSAARDALTPPIADGQEVIVTAHVIGEGEIRAQGSRGDLRQRIDFETDQVEVSKRSPPSLVYGLRFTAKAIPAKPQWNTEKTQRAKCGFSLTASACVSRRSFAHLAISATPGLLTTKSISPISALRDSGPCASIASKLCRASWAAASKPCAAAFIEASSPKSTRSGSRAKRR